MDLITEGKKTLDETVNESRKMLIDVMSTLEKEKEKIKNSIKEAQMKQDTVGKCNKCYKPMIIRTSKKNKRFVGCTGFPDCKNTFSLPQKGSIIVTDKVCKECNAPIVKIKSSGKRAWELCINNECSAKKPTNKK
jgi:DNA topoisomerase-1